MLASIDRNKSTEKQQLRPGITVSPYYLVELVPVLPEEPDVLGEPGLNLLVEQELGKDNELLPQELVAEVHRRVHHPSAVSPESIKRYDLGSLVYLRSIVPFQI